MYFETENSLCSKRTMVDAPPVAKALLAPLDANAVMHRAEFAFATSSLKRRRLGINGVATAAAGSIISASIASDWHGHCAPSAESTAAKQTHRTRFSANKLCAKLDWAARLDKLCKTRSACHFPIIAVAQSFLRGEEERLQIDLKPNFSGTHSEINKRIDTSLYRAKKE